MLTFDATEQINEVSRTTTRTTTQVMTRYFGRWPQTKTKCLEIGVDMGVVGKV